MSVNADPSVPFLALRGLHKRFGENHVLRGVVTLDPWTGEVLRVHCIGPSSSSCDLPTVLGEARS